MLEERDYRIEEVKWAFETAHDLLRKINAIEKSLDSIEPDFKSFAIEALERAKQSVKETLKFLRQIEDFSADL